jgi:hypothetical protein
LASPAAHNRAHRVSYASLRALAATLQMDVDLLERELYAMQQSTEDFVEVPRWVRLMSDGTWLGIPPMSRKQILISEAYAAGSGLLFLIASFVITVPWLVTLCRVAAGFHLVAAYSVSLGVRIKDHYEAWPVTEVSWRTWRPVHTWRHRVMAYTFVLAVSASFFAVVFWLAP